MLASRRTYSVANIRIVKERFVNVSYNAFRYVSASIYSRLHRKDNVFFDKSKSCLATQA